MSRITVLHDSNGCFRFHSNGEMPVSVLCSMHDNAESLSDIDLTGALPTSGACDLRPIRAHKAVLAKHSDHMFKLFTVNGKVDSSKITHAFTDIDHASLRSIIQLLYTDNLKVQEVGAVERVKGILVGAKRLNMKKLAEACEGFLANSDRIDRQNCIDMFQFALKHNCTVLLGAVCGFIAKNLLTFSKSTKFLGLAQDEFAKFLQSQWIFTANADDRCRAAMAWLNYESPSRASSAECIMSMAPLDAIGVKPETLLLAARSAVVRPTIKGLALITIEALERLERNGRRMSQLESEHKKLKLDKARGEGWYVIGGCENTIAFYRYDVTERRWSVLPDLPWTRHKAGACAVGKQVIVMGGVKRNMYVAAIDEYDTVLQAWSAGKAKLTPGGRNYPAVAADSKYAYAFGGCAYSSEASVYRVAERYSAGPKKMETLADMREARYQAAAVCKSDDIVFVVGGILKAENNEGVICNCVDQYNHANRKWSKVAETKELRRSPGAVFLGDDLYMAGGCESKKVEILDTHIGKIRFCAAEMGHVREGCSAVPLNQHVMCVLGGRSSPLTAHSSVETYDKREGKWSVGVIVPDMPKARSEFCLAHVRP